MARSPTRTIRVWFSTKLLGHSNRPAPWIISFLFLGPDHQIQCTRHRQIVNHGAILRAGYLPGYLWCARISSKARSGVNEKKGGYVEPKPDALTKGGGAQRRRSKGVGVRATLLVETLMGAQLIFPSTIGMAKFVRLASLLAWTLSFRPLNEPSANVRLQGSLNQPLLPV